MFFANKLLSIAWYCLVLVDTSQGLALGQGGTVGYLETLGGTSGLYLLKWYESWGRSDIILIDKSDEGSG